MPYIFFLRGDWGLASATLASPWLRPCTVFVNAALSEMLARGSTETRQLQRLMTKTAAASGKTAAGAASDVYAGTEYTKERNYDDGKATEMRAGGGGKTPYCDGFSSLSCCFPAPVFGPSRSSPTFSITGYCYCCCCCCEDPAPAVSHIDPQQSRHTASKAEAAGSAMVMRRQVGLTYVCDRYTLLAARVRFIQ